jgi:hypothetical protein
VFEVEGVGQVQGGGAIGDPGRIDLVDAEVHAAGLVGHTPFVFPGLGVEPDQRLIEEPVDLSPGHGVGERGEVVVDMAGSLCG